MAPTIETQPTIDLHDQIVARYRTDPDEFERLFNSANERLAGLGARFECSRRIKTAITAFLIDESTEQRLREVAEGLHGIVEKLLNWTMDDPELRERAFADHARFFPFLQQTRGSGSWQNYSRYDTVVTPTGEIKVIELNTGCPAGFTLMENVDIAAGESLSALLEAACPSTASGTSVSSGPVVRSLLDVEEQAKITPGLIVLANDENQLMQELQPLVNVFQGCGREAVIANAADMKCVDRQLLLGERPVSMTLNKMRLSTPDSPGHNWSPGFHQRYEGFLRAQQNQWVVSMNNLCAMSIAEDKGLLSVLTWPEVFSRYSRAEQDFIRRHVLPTWRFGAESNGQFDDIVANKTDYVLKPANEGRGLHVSVGPFCDEAAWRRAIEFAPAFPCVAQQFERPLQLPIVCQDPSGQMSVQQMFVTFGLAVVRGKYQGLVSRISSSPVTNVAQHGMLQATFRTGN